MSVWNKLVTAVRGAANEAGESVADKNALRILDQEIRDANTELRRAKDQLTQVMANRKGAERRVGELQTQIDRYMQAAGQALDASNEALATEVAGRISELEAEQQQQQGLLQNFQNSEQALKGSIQKTERNLKAMTAQVHTVKATAAVHKAQSAIAARHSGTESKMRNAMDSLERIKQKQIEQQDRFAAAEELEGENSSMDLDKRLAAAGIGGSAGGANDVLARLKASKQKGQLNAPDKPAGVTVTNIDIPEPVHDGG